MADQSIVAGSCAPAPANLAVAARSGASPEGTGHPGNGTPRGMRAAEVLSCLFGAPPSAAGEEAVEPKGPARRPPAAAAPAARRPSNAAPAGRRPPAAAPPPVEEVNEEMKTVVGADYPNPDPWP